VEVDPLEVVGQVLHHEVRDDANFILFGIFYYKNQISDILLTLIGSFVFTYNLIENVYQNQSDHYDYNCQTIFPPDLPVGDLELRETKEILIQHIVRLKSLQAFI